MKSSSTALKLLAGLSAAAAAYALASRTTRRDTDERVVLITGGSRGLGLALAERFGRAGCRLILTARDVDELMRARYTLLDRHAVRSPESVLLIPADLTDPDQAQNLIDHAIAHFGRIDVLINNAGIIEVGPVEDQPLAAYRRAMATNFFAALHTTQAALPHMLRIAHERPASIANIASIGGKVPVPHLLPYVASKFALVGFSQGLHAELRHKGIRVTTVCPGLMRTGSHVHASFVGDEKKESRWFNLAATTPVVAASARHAAKRIYYAVAAGRAEITITPQAWLAARIAGVAPATTQFLAALANEYILPESPVSDQLPLRFNLRTLDHHRLHRIHEDQPDQTPIPFDTEPAKEANRDDATDPKTGAATWPTPSDQP
ncbi:SDR family NAD(P)-dependent oxidoreductase [Edaphobacter aggregans]|uniref:SDR family NAD(P)-dependent oxidoreductase n=1 Tax=Edaphobacter aggregans TaxID=570835 RepID=UPI0009FD26C3|nr:SDR family oxidoreductase [Edaphobacter aggregans]